MPEYTARSSAPYYIKFHIGDYIRDCEELSLLQHGAYFRLMLWYYSTGKPLPNDMQRVYRRVMALSHEERQAVDYVLAEFFRLKDNVWTHKRIDKELAEWDQFIGSSRRGGVNSAAARGTFRGTSDAPQYKVNKNNETTSTPLPSYVPTPLPSNQNQNQNQNQNHKTKGASAFELPSWVPAKPWADWVEMRKKLRKAPTVRAMELAVHELQKLASEGHDPKAVLEQSVLNGWQGLFPLKTEAKKQDAWWASEQATKAKGAELGIYPRGGESWNEFRSRIKAKLEAA